MTTADTARALALIGQELQRIPVADREAISDRVLGALQGRFLIVPLPSAADEAASRDEAIAEMPWLFGHQGKATT